MCLFLVLQNRYVNNVRVLHYKKMVLYLIADASAKLDLLCHSNGPFQNQEDHAWSLHDSVEIEEL